MAKKTPARGLSFGDRLTYSSIDDVNYALSADKKAFDLRFDRGIAAGVGDQTYDTVALTGAPINTCLYSVVIPATGRNVKTTFSFQGFGETEPGTTTTLVVTINDQHMIRHFPTNKSERGFTASYKYESKQVTDIRINVMLLAERDAGHPDATALIVVTEINCDAALAPRSPARTPKAKAKTSAKAKPKAKAKKG